MGDGQQGSVLTAGLFCCIGGKTLSLYIPSFFSCTMVSSYSPPPRYLANNWRKRMHYITSCYKSALSYCALVIRIVCQHPQM